MASPTPRVSRALRWCRWESCLAPPGEGRGEARTHLGVLEAESGLGLRSFATLWG